MSPLSFACIWLIILAVTYAVICAVLWSQFLTVKAGRTARTFYTAFALSFLFALLAALGLCAATYFILNIGIAAVPKFISASASSVLDNYNTVRLDEDGILSGEDKKVLKKELERNAAATEKLSAERIALLRQAESKRESRTRWGEEKAVTVRRDANPF